MSAQRAASCSFLLNCFTAKSDVKVASKFDVSDGCQRAAHSAFRAWSVVLCVARQEGGCTALVLRVCRLTVPVVWERLLGVTRIGVRTVKYSLGTASVTILLSAHTAAADVNDILSAELFCTANDCEALAQQGNAEAQYSLAVTLEDNQRYSEAAQLYRSAAEQGFLSAQTSLGRLYEQGEGVAQNYTEALRWYRSAAELGDEAAMRNLAWMLADGKGVEKNDAQAAQWFRKLAEQGDASKQYNLGAMYATGVGVGRDYEKALQWYLASAKQGYAHAQYSLGLMYYFGNGVAVDDATAHMWFNIAAANGAGDRVVELRSSAAENLTTEQVAEAQDRAQQCMDSNYTDC